MKKIKQLLIKPDIDLPNTIKVDRDAVFLSVLSHSDRECYLHALVDEKPKNVVDVDVYFFSSGQKIKSEFINKLTYIGSITLHREVFRFHVFVDKRSKKC